MQRIAVCYFVVVDHLPESQSAGAGNHCCRIACLLYWLVMKTPIPAPGYAAGDLSMEGSLASWVDRTLLAGHIYRPLYDPEGILSTVPAIPPTCLSGVLAGQLC